MLLIAVSVPSWQAALVVAAAMTGATDRRARRSGRLVESLTAPLGFLAIGAITLAFQVDSSLHVALAPGGLELAGRLGARALAGVSCLLFLALTTPAADLVGGMRRLGLPAEIAEMSLLMYRFLFLLTDTAEAMNAAQTARLGHVTYGRHMKSLSLLIANLMPRAFARARSLEVGLAARVARRAARAESVRSASALNMGIIVALELLVLAFGLWAHEPSRSAWHQPHLSRRRSC